MIVMGHAFAGQSFPRLVHAADNFVHHSLNKNFCSSVSPALADGCVDVDRKSGKVGLVSIASPD
jgi:hypothetical protein